MSLQYNQGFPVASWELKVLVASGAELTSYEMPLLALDKPETDLRTPYVHSCAYFGNHTTQCLAGLRGNYPAGAFSRSCVSKVSQCDKERSSRSFCRKEVIR